MKASFPTLRVGKEAFTDSDIKKAAAGEDPATAFTHFATQKATEEMSLSKPIVLRSST